MTQGRLWVHVVDADHEGALQIEIASCPKNDAGSVNEHRTRNRTHFAVRLARTVKASRLTLVKVPIEEHPFPGLLIYHDIPNVDIAMEYLTFREGVGMACDNLDFAHVQFEGQKIGKIPASRRADTSSLLDPNSSKGTQMVRSTASCADTRITDETRPRCVSVKPSNLQMNSGRMPEFFIIKTL